MKKYACLIVVLVSVLSGCSNPTGGIITEDSAYQSLKSVSGTTGDGNYTIEVGEATTGGIIKRTLSFGLTTPDNCRYAFLIMRNTRNSTSVFYQAMIAYGQLFPICNTTSAAYAINGNEPVKNFPLSDVAVTGDRTEDGYHYLYAMGSMQETEFCDLKKQTDLTVKLQVNDATVSFIVPYAFIYGLSAYF